MQQVVIIWGGDVFETYDQYLDNLRKRSVRPFDKRLSWRNNIADELGDSYQVMVPEMPCKWFADYVAWKIWFERHIEHIIDPQPIYIGWSLGTTFLLKYLTENTPKIAPSQLHLVSSYVTNSHPWEVLGSFEFELTKTPIITSIVPKVHLWHSTDDTIVPYSDCEILHNHMPTSIIHTFSDRWHFIQENFPELVATIKWQTI